MGAIAYPTNTVSMLVAVLYADEQSRILRAQLDERDDRFIAVVKAADMSYSGGRWWERKFPPRFGKMAHRAAELGRKLLAAGFAVDFHDDEVRALAASGEFEPEPRRWILRNLSGEFKDWFCLSWGREQPDFYYRARTFLAGNRYDSINHCVVIPRESVKELEDFARVHDFRFSESALEILDQARREYAERYLVNIPREKTVGDDVLPWPTLQTTHPKVPLRLRDAQYMDFGLATDLLPHQAPAVEKMLPLRVGGLFMDMGLGKTRAAIELAYRRRHRISSVVWFCPCSLKETIAHEIAKHTDSKSLYTFDDKTTPANLPSAFWYIVGLESIGSSDRAFLAANQLMDERAFVVVDESSYIKGYTAKRTRRLTEIAQKTQYRLLLTGTPLSQGPEDLYAQMTFLDQAILGYNSFYSFAANHLEYHPDYPGMVVRAHNTDYLASRIAPYVYQVTKDECLDLPDKLYKSRYFSLTTEQQDWYQQAKEEILLNAPDPLDSYTIFQLFGALQQIASGFWNAHRVEFDHCRASTLLDILETIPTNERVIVWCKYVYSVKALAEMLPDAHVYHGEMTTAERGAALQRWRDNGRVLLITLGTGGHGLTLTESAYAVYYEQGFKYAERIQSEDRIHRIGQTRRPTYISIFARCGIEERIESALGHKEDVVKAFRREVNKARDKYTSLEKL